MSADAADLQKALQDANEAREHLYLALLRGLERRFGRDAAIAAMREALRAWGRHLGRGLARHAPDEGAAGSAIGAANVVPRDLVAKALKQLAAA